MKCASTFIFDMIKYRLMCIYGNLIEKKSKGVGQWVGGGGGGGWGGGTKKWLHQLQSFFSDSPSRVD